MSNPLDDDPEFDECPRCNELAIDDGECQMCGAHGCEECGEYIPQEATICQACGPIANAMTRLLNKET